MDELLNNRLAELADLLLKRDKLRLLYAYLKQHGEEHPNVLIWLDSVKRSAERVDRRIELLTKALSLGVLS